MDMIVDMERPGALPGQDVSRVGQVWTKLHQVTDPELDESVVDLDFISSVDVDDGNVKVGFRLPTYWCAVNFAFMMADDMRSAVAELSWVRRVDVALGEHMYADTINSGVAAGRSFQESFGDEADGDLTEVRRTFLLKSFQRRQEALLLHFLALGYDAADLVAMLVGDLDQKLDRSNSVTEETRKLVARYLQRRGVPGPYGHTSAVFVTTADEPLQIESFDVYVRGLRRVRVNAEFNGALCRGLLAVRFDLSPVS